MKNNDKYQNIIGKNILVMELDPMNRRVAQIILQNSGANVITAKDSVDALIYVSEKNIDLAVIGIDYPVVEAYAALSNIKHLKSDMPVIASTRLVHNETRGKCLQAGFDDYFTIPHMHNEMLSILNNYLKK